MSLKRGFWWGKVSGFFAGGLFGGLCFALPFLLDATLNGRLQSEPELIFVAFLYGVSGVFAGAFGGAVIGTILGFLTTWLRLVTIAPTIWLVVWTIVALFAALLTFLTTDEFGLLLPAIWVWLGGFTGWQGGSFFERRMIGNPPARAI